MGFATIGEGFYTIANSFNSDNAIKSYDDVKNDMLKFNKNIKNENPKSRMSQRRL
jgi:hypothetical protein